MPYQKIDDLPASVKGYLPEHAQLIYLKAFNNALQEYKDKSKRDDPDEDIETVAHKVAWGAVKQQYEKNPESGFWHKKREQ